MSPVKIDDIPSEVLLRIFSYYVGSEGNKNLLDNVANVCRRWRETALMPALWSDIQVHKQMETSLEDLREFAEKGLLSHTLGLMVIDNHCRLGTGDFKDIISKCQRLQKLHVYGVGLHIDATDVAVSCPGLEKLHLLNRRLFSVPDCKFNIRKFKACCPRMKELILRNVSFEYDGAHECEGFEMLESFTCYCELTDKELYQIVGNSLRMRHLDVPNHSLSGALKLSSGKFEEVEYVRGGGSSDVCTEILQKWKNSLKSLKAIMFLPLPHSYCEFGDALRLLVDEKKDGSENPITSVQLHNVILTLDDLAHFVRYAGNLAYLDTRGVYYGLPEDYRREYSSKESVQGLRQSLMKNPKVAEK